MSAGILINFSYDAPTYFAALGLVLSAWILVTTTQEILQRVNALSSGSLFERLRKLTPSHWGMILGHLGFAVTIIGITLVSNYEVERDVRMVPGESVTLGGYEFAFQRVESRNGPNYTADVGIFDVYQDGEKLVHLEPEKRLYIVQRMPMTEAGIYSTVFRDLFIAMGEPLDDGAWAIRVYIKPFVTWIWAGAIFMALGGVCSISDRRYRMAKLAKVKKAVTPGNVAAGESA